MADPIDIEIRRVEDADVTERLDADIRGLLCACFTKPEDAVFRTRRFFTESPRYRWLALDGPTLVGHVAAHDKLFQTARGPIRVLGVAEVCVAPSHRRLGLARQMLAALHEFGSASGFDFAFLFGRAELYSSSGYSAVMNALRVTPPGEPPKDSVHEEAMRRALGAERWPDDLVDLRGPVF